ncbi:MAG: hypothetical protein DHS20C01_06710 [marine bacterium B5-7]|nr:MAG: hypothetical protein DHS20C01_06710 [marine bacterium B5-7]
MNDRININAQSGIARLPVLIASVALTVSLALVALDRLLLPDRFSIQEVVVTGNAPNVDPARVLHAVRQLGPRSWFSVDLAEVERVVGDVPWVYRASVRRRWPGRLIVSVSQAQPVARWNDDGWVNNDGETLSLPSGFTGADLPSLQGPQNRSTEVVARFNEIDTILSTVPVVKPVSLKLDGRGVWVLGLNTAKRETPLIVTIGRGSIVPRLMRLTEALKSSLAARLPQLASIDLRYPNGLAVAPIENTNDGGVVQTAPQPPSSDAG